MQKSQMAVEKYQENPCWTTNCDKKQKRNLEEETGPHNVINSAALVPNLQNNCKSPHDIDNIAISENFGIGTIPKKFLYME